MFKNFDAWINYIRKLICNFILYVNFKKTCFLQVRASNVFKKVDDSANNNFENVNSVAGKTLSSVHDGLNSGLKTGSVMRQVSNKLAS